jgi:probable selenium-dependent hydroxylase accessory protein YqeC
MTSLRQGLMLTEGGVVSIVGAGGKTSLMFRIAKELSQAGESVLTTTTTKILIPRKDQSPKVIVSDSLAEILNKSGVMIKDADHITAASAVLTAMFDSQSRQAKTRYRQKLVGFQAEFIDEIYRAGVFRWILVEADGAAGRPLKAPDPHEPVIPKFTAKIIGVLGLDGVGKALIDKWVFRPHRFSEITGRGDGEMVTESDCVMAVIHKNGIMKGAPSGTKCLLFLNKADRPGRLAVARKIVRLLAEKKDSGLQRIIIGQALHEPPVIECYDL